LRLQTVVERNGEHGDEAEEKNEPENVLILHDAVSRGAVPASDCERYADDPFRGRMNHRLAAPDEADPPAGCSEFY